MQNNIDDFCQYCQKKDMLCCDLNIVDRIFREQTKIITEYIHYSNDGLEDNSYDISKSLTNEQIKGIKEIYLYWIKNIKDNNDIKVVIQEIWNLSKLDYFLPCDTNSNLTSFRPSTRTSAITFNHGNFLHRIYLIQNVFIYITPNNTFISDKNFEKIVDKIWYFFSKKNDNMQILSKNKNTCLKTNQFFKFYESRCNKN